MDKELKIAESNISINQLIRKNYSFDKFDIELHREMIGSIYIVKTIDRKYIFKLYKEVYKEEAIISIDVLEFIASMNGPIPKIIKTTNDKNYLEIDNVIGVLFEYIKGEEVASLVGIDVSSKEFLE